MATPPDPPRETENSLPYPDSLRIDALPLPSQAARPELQAPNRGPVGGRNGVVASAHHSASLAGIDTLRSGGNAIDAAIAMSAVMAVVQPYSSHLGGDAFALIRTAGGVTLALNAGGRAPRAASIDGYPDGIPLRGATSVAVPGLVDAWCALTKRLATKPLTDLLAPAIALARDGFAVSRGLAQVIRATREVLEADAGCADLFLEYGPPAPGRVLVQPDLATTLEAIAADGREGFYGGATGARIVACLREGGSRIDEADMARDQAVWGKPLSIPYNQWTVYEQPLPSQGITALLALNTIEGFHLGAFPPLSAQVVHESAEAMRLALLDRQAYCGDPDAVNVDVERLLSKAHAAEQRGRIGETAAAPVAPHGGDTTSFVTADGEGNLVSFIQSLFQPWGSAVLVPGTGVLLNDRMRGFDLDTRSPNVLRGGGRTLHTLNTWLLERPDGLVYAGGTPGADYQVQVNTQLVSAIVDFGMNPQVAIDAPKWVLTGPGNLALESRYPDATFDELSRRGHDVMHAQAWDSVLCRCQIAGRRADGSLVAASDPRADGAALAY